MTDREKSLYKKALKRKEYLKVYVKEQLDFATLSRKNPRSIVVFPMVSGIGNNIGMLAEAILLSMITHRRLMRKEVAFLLCSL